MKIFIKCLILLLVFCEAAYANSFEKLSSIENTAYHNFKSKVLDKNYHIYVKAPKILKQNKKFITIYLLDGDITFPLLASYSTYLNLAQDIPEIILVGISYGTDDWKKGNARSHDFTAPAKDRDHYGGAENFQKMLSQELFPMIETNYPSDSNKRVLFGQSIGGQFAIFTTMFHPENFWGAIASNPALHRNLEFFKGKPKSGNTKSLLFVSRAEKDEDRFIKPLDQWLNHWNKNPHPWIMKSSWLKNHNHFSAAPDAFRKGLMWLITQDK